jgi:membrane protease YdiL (CAAX protease family)
MSILLDPPSLTRRARPGSAAGWLALYVLIVIVGGAWVGGWLLHSAMINESGFLFDAAQKFGADRLVRRFQTVLAVVLAPLLLKKIGWRGANDLGWNSAQPRSQRFRDFKIWFGIGLGLMTVLFGLSLYSGIREWRPISVWSWIWTLVPAFLITGIGVGIIEETLTRGVLYRSMERVWTSWTGAVISSSLFAWAHFMKASDESFLQGPWAVLHSSLFDEFSNGPTPLKCLNMFLFGLVLCRLVRYRGDIWAAVGLHAAAVGAIKWFSAQTEFNREIGYQAWLGGHSSKFDDGWAMSVMLTAVLFGLELYFSTRPASSRVSL